MRLCSYVVKVDSGLAPNPFGGCSTLAVCTPNHMGIKLSKDDWILGTTPKRLGSKLVYAMKVDEVLHFNDYYHHPHYTNKRPNPLGEWKEMVGDNMYYLSSQGQWRQAATLLHKEEHEKRKDLKNPYVFIGQHFFYFGESAPALPQTYVDLMHNRQGCKCNHDSALVNGFIMWLQGCHRPGIYGLPRDRQTFCKSVISCSDG